MTSFFPDARWRQAARRALLRAHLTLPAALCLTAFHSPVIHAQEAAVFLDIPAQSLDAALIQLGRQTGLQVFYAPEAVSGLRAPALQGRLTPDQALARLLAGQPVDYRREGREVTLNRSDVTQLKPVTVLGNTLPPGAALQQEGGEAEGYRVRTVSSLGTLGAMDIRDAPYAITVVPRDLITNIQAQSPDDVFRINPTTQSTTPQMTGWAPMVRIRGFGTYDTAEDGLRRPNSFATSMEDKERVEVLSGLSGFMYGAASPGGMVNYVYKRPTLERLNSLTVGNYGGSQYYAHGDFGGRIDAQGRAGYRLNVVRQDGSTAIDDQKVDRTLISGALDWQLTDRLLAEVNASYHRYRTEGASAYWTYRPGVSRTPVPDASKQWSQPWIRDEFEKTRLMGKLTYQASDRITLRGSVMREYHDRPVQDHTMNSGRLNDEYYQIAIRSGRTKNEYQAATLMADIDLETGSLSHRLTLGYYGYSDKSWATPDSPNTGWLGPFPRSTPVHRPEPVFPDTASRPYYSGKMENQNLFLGDVIEFGDQWTLIAGVNHSRIRTRSLNAQGVRTQPDYDQRRNSPSVSLSYKPLSWLTTYATYIEGLEQGGVAPEEASNRDQIMAPMVSKQKEIGVKASVGGTLLTAALFDIEKAYEFIDGGNTYTQDGRQQHRGLELTASGKVSERVTVFGGLTWLDAKVKQSALDGKMPMNVSRTVAKLYSEYAFAEVPGLALTGGIYYTGKQWADDANTSRLPSFTTADVGLRYATKVSGKPLTLRLNVNNLADRNYWINSYYVGPPRSVAFSAQMQF
ncbi:Ferrichrome-iron receptor [plant metagenome]|uniref:Ferrichrome-iron receptor n=1 Tax=plant metagenome TaxID=1297885 RepID=A0A484U9I1_9ZZZZ